MMPALKATSAWGCVLVAICLGPVLAVPATAQEVPKASKLAAAAQQGWVKFGIVSGRVAITGMRTSISSSSSSGGERTERLSIRANSHLSYELTDPNERFSLDVTGGSQVRIHRIPKGDSDLVQVQFHQLTGQPVALTVGSGGQQRVIEAASLWHLLIREPETCRKHLVPLLAAINGQWDLAGRVAELEEALLAAAEAGDSPDRERWAALVEQLADERFSRREAADRELRESGPAVIPYLQQLEPNRLDAEQHYRIRRIILSATEAMVDDTPEQLTAWLLADRAIWLAMLSRPEESTRRAAAAQLKALLGSPVAFDPAADAKTRQAQIEQLRRRISGN